MKVTLFASVDDAMGLCRGGETPWWLFDPHVRRWLHGRTLVMGKRTWENIVRFDPFNGCDHVVVSRQPVSGALQCPGPSFLPNDSYTIIGGVQTFHSLLRRVHRIELVRHPGNFQCNSHLLALSDNAWTQVDSKPFDQFRIVATYERKEEK